MENCAFEAYITNLGKYNDGELVGEWVKLPLDNNQLQEVFKRIGLNAQYEEWFIADYDCLNSALYNSLGEYERLSELNYLAHQIQAINNETCWEAALEHGEYTHSVKDLINLTENLDCYDFISGIADHADLGYYWVEESGCYNVDSMGSLANYIDYESLGRDIALEENGSFTSTGYIRQNGDSFDEIYNGQIDDIPDEYMLYRIDEAEHNKDKIANIQPKVNKRAELER